EHRKLRKTMEAMQMRPVALHERAPGYSRTTVGELLTDEGGEDWCERISAGIDAHLVDAAMEDLEAMPLDIIAHRFGLHGAARWTFRRLAERHGLSAERIRQIEVATLARLRAAVEASPISSLALVEGGRWF